MTQVCLSAFCILPVNKWWHYKVSEYLLVNCSYWCSVSQHILNKDQVTDPSIFSTWKKVHKCYKINLWNCKAEASDSKKMSHLILAYSKESCFQLCVKQCLLQVSQLLCCCYCSFVLCEYSTALVKQTTLLHTAVV